MSIVLQPPATAPLPAPTLAVLRQELDRLDDALHDLIMARAGVVEQVALHGHKGRVALRPGREAQIIRRLLARHTGRFPRSSLVRLWRELMCGNTALQAPLLLAVCEPVPSGGYTAAAREHFGPLTALHVYRTPAQAIGQISAGLATAAVLPLPAEGELPAAAWWIALLHKDEPRIHVTARLPFWTTRPEGASDVQALLVCAAAPDPSGSDRSLLGIELSLETSRDRLAQAMTAAGFVPGVTILRRDPGDTEAQALVDVAGFVADDDPRLADLATVLRPPIVIGAYAIPVGAEPR